MSGHPFTKEEKHFIHENYRGRSLKELTSLLNAKFGTDYPERKVKCYKGNHALNSGLSGRFEKGSVSFNKGLKIDEFMSPEGAEAFRSTQYKSGHSPTNHRPIGSECRRSDGYTWVKIGEPKRWTQKHVMLWERAHNTERPKGSRVIFLDGDTTNFDIDNLACVTGREHVVLNGGHLRFEDKELTKTGVNIARLRCKILDMEKDNGN